MAPDIRWYLKRHDFLEMTVALVAEERAEPRRGYMISVVDRRDARAKLPRLRLAVEQLPPLGADGLAVPLYDPVEVDDPKA